MCRCTILRCDGSLRIFRASRFSSRCTDSPTLGVRAGRPAGDLTSATRELPVSRAQTRADGYQRHSTTATLAIVRLSNCLTGSGSIACYSRRAPSSGFASETCMWSMDHCKDRPPNKCAAANRRPAGQLDGSGGFRHSSMMGSGTTEDAQECDNGKGRSTMPQSRGTDGSGRFPDRRRSNTEGAKGVPDREERSPDGDQLSMTFVHHDA